MNKEIAFAYPIFRNNYWAPDDETKSKLLEEIENMTDVPKDLDKYKPWCQCGPYLVYGYGFGYDMSEKKWFGNPKWHEECPNYPYK
jgi:hypothetical protein